MTAALDRAAALAAGIRIAAARRAVTDACRAAGLDSPALEARILTGHATGRDHAGLAAAADQPLTATEAERLREALQRRLAGEPVARIVGQREFWSLTLTLSPETLVPRPETETVVEAALAALDTSGGRNRPLRILDLGTGSGAILIALLRELPQASGVGTDRSSGALVTARQNASRHGVGDRAVFVCADFGAAVAASFDCVVSNPPYIESDTIHDLAPEVRRHDPRLALDGGPDGLDAYRAIAADAGRLLARQGALVLELGVGQQDQVTGLCTARGLSVESPVRCDLAGLPRALTARRA